MTDTVPEWLNSTQFAEMGEAEKKRLASRWWERVGRHAMPVMFNRYAVGGSARAGGGLHAFLVLPGMEDDIPSGILRGLPWEELRDFEQSAIVECYAVALVATERQYEAARREALGREAARRHGIDLGTERKH